MDMPRKHIKKVNLHNFKRFDDFSVELDERLNLFIGDNDSGKSSLLLAIELALGGNRNRVEVTGLDSLFNVRVVEEFLNRDVAERVIKNLPTLHVQLYLNEQNNPDLNGDWNSDGVTTDGLQLLCEPRQDLSEEINEILQQDNPIFPFEYYSILFKTFSGSSYTGYRRFLRYLFIDNTEISNEYATRSYIRTVYENNAKENEQSKHKYEYRQFKQDFQDSALKDLNERVGEDYSFTVRNNSKSNLETDLTISEDGIDMDNMGKGKQCFVRTEFALTKKAADRGLDVVLLEEPENHLSHGKMKELILAIQSASESQLFVATHSSLVSARLDLRKSILLNSCSQQPTMLSSLSPETAKFFIKAPNTNILEFALSTKVILVEGDSEYMLMSAFFENVSGNSMEDANVHVISVGGTSFKRYLELATLLKIKTAVVRLLKIKTAVVRDNDRNYQENCVDHYSEYADCGHVAIFSDTDENRYTFEVAMYEDNKNVCDKLFEPGRRTLSVQDYMLSEKSETAYTLLDKKSGELNTPDYITQAIVWINE